MAIEIILPRVDMDMTTGQISRWFFEEGASVTKGQVLFEIETDKAAMEIDAAASGILTGLASTGVQVPVGSVVGWIAAVGEVFNAPDATQPEKQQDLAIPAVTPAAKTADLAPPVSEVVIEGTRATPLARRLALQNEVSLAEVGGSGPRGRIQSHDVEAYVALNVAQITPPAQQSITAPTAKRLPLSAPMPSDGVLNSAWLRQGEGTPLVLVHGFGADLNSWRPLVQSLGTNRPVFAVDLPGHGGSSLNDVSSIADIADQLATTFVAAEIRAAHLIGHSLGAAAATLAVERFGGEVKSLLLISPAGLGPEINSAFIEGYCRSSSEDSLRPWMQLLVTDQSVLSASFIKSTAASRAQGNTFETQRQIANIVFPDGTQAFSIVQALAGLSIPVRVIFGAQDRVIPVNQTLALPGSVAVHKLANIGHMPHIEAKDLLAKLVRQHMASAD